VIEWELHRLKHHEERVCLGFNHQTLVGGLEHEWVIFPYIWNFIIPTDELHHFSEG